MSTYTFSTNYILNSPIVPSSSAYPTYTISTTSGFLGRTVTTLSPTQRPCAIHWRSKKFEIDGRAHKWKDLKHKSGGLFSNAREWQWESGQSYTVKYHDKQWTATPANGLPSAIFTPRRTHLFQANEPAVLIISPEISNADTAFLIFVMLYSATRRQEKQQQAADGAISAAGS